MTIADVLRRRRRRRQRRAVGPDGWTCDVCGAYRPDAAIAVYTTAVSIGGVAAKHNVRYCTDRAACRAGAVDVRHLAAAAAS